MLVLILNFKFCIEKRLKKIIDTEGDHVHGAKIKKT
jgi:hypothetical protein